MDALVQRKRVNILEPHCLWQETNLPAMREAYDNSSHQFVPRTALHTQTSKVNILECMTLSLETGVHMQAWQREEHSALAVAPQRRGRVQAQPALASPEPLP